MVLGCPRQQGTWIEQEIENEYANDEVRACEAGNEAIMQNEQVQSIVGTIQGVDNEWKLHCVCGWVWRGNHRAKDDCARRQPKGSAKWIMEYTNDKGEVVVG